MKKKEVSSERVQSFEVEQVSYAALIAARVRVVDEQGNEMYLDPARQSGEFILRVVPKPGEATAAEIPAEWKRPPKQDVPEGVIDWGMPPADSLPEREGEEAAE